VIIPTYNRSAQVLKAIESVLNQEFECFELIVVDDGSDDLTIEELAKIDDPKFSFIAAPHKGVSAARNLGIKKSKHELIAFLDSDDLWLPGKISAQVKYFQSHPDVFIAQTEELWVRNGKRVNPCKKHEKRSGWIFLASLPLCIVSPSAVMLKREVFERVGLFDEELLSAEDYDLWLRCSLHYEIHTIDEPLIIKNGGHSDQLSAAWGLDIWRVRSLLKLLENAALPILYRPHVKSEIKRRSHIVCEGAKKRGNEKIYNEFKSIIAMIADSA